MLTFKLGETELTFVLFDSSTCHLLKDEPGIVLIEDIATSDYCVVETQKLKAWVQHFYGKGLVPMILQELHGTEAPARVKLHYCQRPTTWVERPELTEQYGRVKQTLERLLIDKLLDKKRQRGLIEWARRRQLITDRTIKTKKED